MTPEKAVSAARAYWGFTLAGLVFFGTVVALVGADGDWRLPPILFRVSLFLLIVGVPWSCFYRNQLYKKHWQSHAVNPEGYLLANRRMFQAQFYIAICSAASVFLGGPIMPNLLPLVVCFAVVAANFPTGKPMHPNAPRLGDPMG